MTDAAPSHRYYRAMHGRWRGDLRFTVTDWAALGAARAGAVDRLASFAMAVSSLPGGTLRMETSLDYRTAGERGDVVHTTRVSKLGVTAMRGLERITLHPDGRTATMDRAERTLQNPFRDRHFPGAPVTVADTGDAVTYELTWLGQPLLQRTRIVPEGLSLIAENAWSRAEVVLVRWSDELS